MLNENRETSYQSGDQLLDWCNQQPEGGDKLSEGRDQLPEGKPATRRKTWGQLHKNIPSLRPNPNTPPYPFPLPLALSLPLALGPRN